MLKYVKIKRLELKILGHWEILEKSPQILNFVNSRVKKNAKVVIELFLSCPILLDFCIFSLRESIQVPLSTMKRF